METKQKPQTVIPYLIIPDAHKFFDFVQKVFDARETARFLNEDGSLMHGEVNIGGSTIMFGASSEQWQSQPAGLYINVRHADDIFQRALKHGATVVMELSDKDYGRTGGVKDPFGNVWWITANDKMDS